MLSKLLLENLVLQSDPRAHPSTCKAALENPKCQEDHPSAVVEAIVHKRAAWGRMDEGCSKQCHVHPSVAWMANPCVRTMRHKLVFWPKADFECKKWTEGPKTPATKLVSRPCSLTGVELSLPQSEQGPKKRQKCANDHQGVRDQAPNVTQWQSRTRLFIHRHEDGPYFENRANPNHCLRRKEDIRL